MKHFVITGTGRSGTRYMSVLLTQMGIRTGHQSVFHANCLSDEFTPEWGHYKGDSSGLAAPHLLSLPPDDTLIIHLTRHPSKVMHSLIEQRHLPGQDSNESIRVYDKYCPGAISIKNVYRRAAYFWVQWNKIVEQTNEMPYFIHHRIEDHPMPIVRHIANHIDWDHILRPEVVLDVPKDIGTAGRKGKISLNTIKGPVGRDIREMAERYGYEAI